ncbi:uncharacterized protein LOC117188111 isoform X1 [Drosophila miranda]|uniref:uncharacterized protein LOC117188111 isoform X1 n=1 Tax=Drosophila miranda TaxID=7229 RepID=UPI0007E7C3C6|nr:uncharacterized protein LOC117188111 isoform X1 [Drosophila miranda]
MESILQVKLEQPNIKERLNLHVKRRLQQDADTPAESTELFPDLSWQGKRGKAKEPLKQRKPYQKRAEKTKTETTKCKKATQIASPALEAEPLDEQETEAVGSPEAAEHKSTSRDRYKNADILNMVLSSKKRALMQDPEVQAFWTRIMAAIKT